MKLVGSIAIVTGAGQGIGKAIANKFAREGASVVVADILLDQATAVAEKIRNVGGSASAIKVNVADRADVQHLIDETLKEFNKIDILVNNAGIVRDASLVEMTEQEWDIVIDVDLKGVFNCTQAVLPHMMERQYGKIINISSAAGIGASNERLASYASAKAGVVQITKVTAREAGAYGINANCIAPGTIVTELVYRGGRDTKKHLEERKKVAALRRLGEPEDIAKLALFLACEDSSFITGQVIRCDGGRMDIL